MTVLCCAYCGGEFERSPFDNITARWCSQKCRRNDWRIRQEDGVLPPDKSAWDWDGVTQFSQRRTMTFPYVRKCLMCGGESDIEWMTHDRAGLLGRAGLSACPTCGGWRHMDPLEAGGISSSMSAVPRRTVAEPVRAVPRRALA